MGRKCVTYTRVSTKDQAETGYSLPAQRQKLLAFALENQLEISASFEDHYSAAHDGRPEFFRMLSFLETHPDVKIILAERIDRTARNHLDWGRMTEVLGVHVLTLTEKVEDTPAGRLTQGIALAVSKYHSDNLVQEVKKGMRAKFEAGGTNGRAPVGYRNIPRTRTRPAGIDIDPRKAPLVRQLFERYATGDVSFLALGNEMHRFGLSTSTGRPLSKEYVRQMLRNPYYRGFVQLDGQVRPGNHPRVINDELAARVDVQLRRRARTDGTSHQVRFFLLRGLLRCATCGYRLTAEVHPRGTYYACTRHTGRPRCRERFIRAKEIEAAVADLIRALTLAPERVVLLLARLDELRASVGTGRERELVEVRGRLQSLDAEHARLREAVLKGVFQLDDYVNERHRLNDEQENAEHRLRELEKDLANPLRLMAGLVRDAGVLGPTYDELPKGGKHDLLANVFEMIETRERGIVNVRYRPPFDLLLAPELPENLDAELTNAAIAIGEAQNSASTGRFFCFRSYPPVDSRTAAKAA